MRHAPLAPCITIVIPEDLFHDNPVYWRWQARCDGCEVVFLADSEADAHKLAWWHLLTVEHAERQAGHGPTGPECSGGAR